MIRSISLVAASAVVLTSLAVAGQPISDPKGEAPLSPALFGTGPYVGVQAGINAYTNADGRSFTLGGNDISLRSNHEVGFAGGLKLGYVFGTGIVRPAIEADLYYNNVRGNFNETRNGTTRNFNPDASLDTGAFLANFLLRLAFDRFQPYFGGGVGGYYAQGDDGSLTVNAQRFEGSDNSSGFAWQLVGGTDYYFTEKFSGFAEYKWLNYEDVSLGYIDGRLSQQIVVLGLRWHF